jgi:hypothetical protein
MKGVVVEAGVGLGLGLGMKSCCLFEMGRPKKFVL